MEDHVCLRRTNTVAIVQLPEEIDLSNAELILRRLLMILPHVGPRLVLDMTATVYCSVRGWLNLSLLARRAAERGTAVVVVQPRPQQRRYLRLVVEPPRLPVFESVEIAVAPWLTPGPGDAADSA